MSLTVYFPSAFGPRDTLIPLQIETFLGPGSAAAAQRYKDLCWTCPQQERGSATKE